MSRESSARREWRTKRALHKREKNGDYRYGEDSGQDRIILAFLTVSADDFLEAAVKNPNDCELAEWALEKRPRSTARN